MHYRLSLFHMIGYFVFIFKRIFFQIYVHIIFHSDDPGKSIFLWYMYLIYIFIYFKLCDGIIMITFIKFTTLLSFLILSYDRLTFISLQCFEMYVRMDYFFTLLLQVKAENTVWMRQPFLWLYQPWYTVKVTTKACYLTAYT